MSLWRWSKWLPQIPSEARLDLGAGGTPLVPSRHIGPSVGLNNLYFKVESNNPTGSYKDRFAALAISAMRAAGKTLCVATSSGNTGAALAAHCSAAGIRCRIAIVENAPLEKLDQMCAYGAEIFIVKGFGASAEVTRNVMEHLKTLGERPEAAMQISAFAYSPTGMKGVKTISFELHEQSDTPIGHVFCPVGGGGLALAVARGFEDLAAHESLTDQPRIHCVQPDGNDTVAGPVRKGEQARSVTCTSRISGLQVPSVIDGHQLIEACRRSGGTGHVVTDEQIWQVQAGLSRKEGIFCEPAAAVSVAGALAACERGEVNANDVVVCLITGTGFKDRPSVERMVRDNVTKTIDSTERLCGEQP